MKSIKNVVVFVFVLFLLFSLLKNILSYSDKIRFFETYSNNYEKEKKKNIELKTEIIKKKSLTEVEKTIRNNLNLLKEDEVALILSSPTPTPRRAIPTPVPVFWKQWMDLFIK